MLVSEKELLFEVEDDVAIVTLNLPAKLNALSRGVNAGLWGAMDEVRDNDAIGAMILTGTGRGFCSGADVQAMAGAVSGESAGDGAPAETRPVGQIPSGLRSIPKPVLGAINGVAAGGGFSIAMACDIRIASENARFIAAWIRRAFMPDLGISYTLPRAVGMSKAFELIATGDAVDAEEAERIGLVSRVVPQEQLMSTTLELAKRLAKQPAMVIRYAKEALFKAQQMDFDATVELEAERFATCMGSEDAAEGIKAFVEKREPKYTGR